MAVQTLKAGTVVKLNDFPITLAADAEFETDADLIWISQQTGEGTGNGDDADALIASIVRLMVRKGDIPAARSIGESADPLHKLHPRP